MIAPETPSGDLQALARGIDLASGTAFYFLVVNDPRARDAAINKVKSYLRRRHVRRVSIRPGSESFLRLLRTLGVEGMREVLVVTGIENILEHDAPFLHSLNASRDSLGRVLNGPVLFVLSQDALVAVMSEAPDFFSTRSGTFFFDYRDMLQFGETRSFHRSAGVDMPPEEIRARIVEAERLLADWHRASEPSSIDRYLRPARRLVELLISIYQIERAEEVARRSLELALDARPAEALSFALNLSQIARLRGDLAEARRYACIVRDLAVRVGDRASLMRAHWLAAESAADQEAQEVDFQLALRLAEEMDDVVSSAQIKASIGLKRWGRGDVSAALDILRDARRDADRAGERPLVAEISSTMASVLLAMGRLSEAEEVARQSLREFERLGDDVQASMAYVELGDVYFAMERFDDAEHAFRRSVELTRRSRILPSREILPLLRLINIELVKNDFASAERFVNEALELIERFRNELPDSQEVEAQLRELLDRLHAATA